MFEFLGIASDAEPSGTAFSAADFEVPAGTLLRFIHRGDHVEVWVGEPESTPTA